MMITPVNFNTVYNTNTIQPKKANTVSFSGGLNVFDMFDGSVQLVNDIVISDRVRNGDLKGAILALRKSGDKYNPNYVDNKTKAPLLINICYPKTFKSKMKSLLSPNYARYRSILIDDITANSNFEPNQFISDGSSAAPCTTYIEEAVKHNDTELVTQLCEIVDTIDPYHDGFKTLMSKTNNPFIKHILSRTALYRGVVGALEEAQNQAKTSENTFFEEDEVKGFRADISDNIPASINDVGGLKKAKSDIEDFIIKPWSPGMRKKLHDNNIDMPNGILMYGPPGCGKTYIAKVIAKQTGFPMYEVDLSNVGSSAGYKTSNTLRAIFKALESQYRKNNIPNILFLDEIDSIAASREDTHTDWKRDDINTLISLLNNASERGVIVIGATNLLDNVDKAVLRTGRFDKKIEITLPNESEREEIIYNLLSYREVALPLIGYAKKLAELTDGKTCSDISAIINDCCRRAIYNYKNSINFNDFKKSVEIVEENCKTKRAKIGF